MIPKPTKLSSLRFGNAVRLLYDYRRLTGRQLCVPSCHTPPLHMAYPMLEQHHPSLRNFPVVNFSSDVYL
jgi:hypothetical protein